MSQHLPQFYTKLYNDIVELRNTFKLVVNSGSLSEKDLNLHEQVFRSEFRELATASTRINILDGIVDSVVTLMGRCVHEGMRPYSMLLEKQAGVAFMMEELICMAKDLNMDFEGAWNEIQRSNLSKVCPTPEDFKKTQANYKKLGVETYGEETPKGMVVKVLATVIGKDGNDYPQGKFLKSDSYSKPDLAPHI